MNFGDVEWFKLRPLACWLCRVGMIHLWGWVVDVLRLESFGGFVVCRELAFSG